MGNETPLFGDRVLSKDMIAGESESESPVSATSSSLGGGTSWYSATGLGSSGTGSMYSVSGIEGNSNQPSNQEPRHTRTWNGKHYPDEDDTSVSWRCHKKHFFILSNAGKPIYSRYGDEHKLAGFSATLQAIMSFVENSGDTIQLVRAGDHQIVFLVKGPLYLVSISATNEPAQALRKQLELLHGQVLLILTKSVEKCFVKNAKFDMRPLLASTDSIFASLIHAFSWNVATFLNSYSCLPLPYATRQAAGAALQATPDAGVLFGVLMCGSKVISVVGPRKGVLSPNDILLLFNFVSSSDAFRRTESFSPVCLPGYNPTAFLYAYVQYLDKDACLILLTADPDGFFKLKECRSQIEVLLRESDVLPQVTNSVQRGGLRVEDLPEPGASTSSLLDSTAPSSPGIEADNELPGETRLQLVVGTGGPAGLWHFVYRSSYLDQYVASEFSPPLHTRAAQKRLFRAYQKLHASMHDGSGAGLHKMQYRRDEHHGLSLSPVHTIYLPLVLRFCLLNFTTQISCSERFLPVLGGLQMRTDTCWLSTEEWTPLTCQFSEYSKNWVWCMTTVFKKYEKMKELDREPVVLYRLFHENCWFFKVFEITRTGGSLILNFFQRTGTCASLILIFFQRTRNI